MIQTFDLMRAYGRHVAVERINLQVARGEMYGFLGLNGAGKTTVMRMICGLLRPNRGYARVGEFDVRGPGDAGRLIGRLSFVSQEMRFQEHATLKELLGVYAGLAGVPVQPGLDFAREIDVPLDRVCAKFSPGQQRKAQLAIALLKQPEYLLLDEPSAGLDPKGVAEMREILRSLNARGATIFLSSHVLSEVQTLCSTVGILHRGQMRYQGKVNEAYILAVPGDAAGAAREVVARHGHPAQLCFEGLQVEAPAARLAVILELLHQAGISAGLVRPVGLEDTFREVIQNDEVDVE